MNGTNKELVGVYKTSTSINSIYQGNRLVWGKQILSNRLTGKFLDDSTESNWWYYANGGAKDDNKTTINVDSISKEFDLDIPLEGNCGSMFFGNSKLERIDSIPITNKVTNIGKMFYHCSNMTSINTSDWDLSEVTNMNELFSDCSKITNIDVSNWIFPKVEYLVGIFSNCSSLQSIDVSNWDTSNITSMAMLFYGCKSLTTIDISSLDKSKVTIINDIFFNCQSLETLNLGDWDMSNITEMDYPFAFCSNLKNVIGSLSGIKIDLSLNVSPLTNESAMIFINGLATVDEAKTITFKATTYNTLTDEQKAIATNKGWTIKSA